MRNEIVRRLLVTGVALALASGAGLAKISKESTKVATKTVAANKSVASSKEAVARQARLKKIGSASAKTEPKAVQHKKTSGPAANSNKKNAPRQTPDQIASSTDDGSVTKRRARIHSMQVPE